ncbi:hypothetical protein SHVI106290_13780 [Shewanella violacea]|uniref:Uncharacterized protein n=3 Tax=Shewanella violacea TaxID=60217 RepID=D4ZFG2_SHEVD|nr:hypothetical protein SVI_0440 [Shewanella violacea DSS12]
MWEHCQDALIIFKNAAQITMLSLHLFNKLLAVQRGFMLFIKESETTLTIWWKFIGSIVLFVVAVVAALTGTLYIPSKYGFLTEESSPLTFIGLVTFVFLLSVLSFWQGGYGIYKKYIAEPNCS